MKNILAIHDLSCFGRCALTVVIPVLSAMAHQVTPLPTALLSTHTGGFENMTFVNLSDTLMPSFEHMCRSGAGFDAVYSGFLGSAEQIEIVSDIIKKSSSSKIFVDPVMGDGGKLYQTYTDEMKERMSELCSLADVITPNLTEASFLLGEDYTDTVSMTLREAEYFAKEKCMRLQEKYGCGFVALTGVEYTENGRLYIGTAALCPDGFEFIENEHVGTGYPGTGDLFASIMLGEMLCEKPFFECARLAAGFVSECVSDTYAAGTPVRNGVLLEKHLYKLIRS